MDIGKETVDYAAGLARIELNPNELEKLSRQLHAILDYIDKLGRLDLSQVKPTDNILSISNVLREDEPRESLPVDKALSNAPRQQEGFFAVPKVVDSQ